MINSRRLYTLEAKERFYEALRSPPPGFTGFVWLTPEDFVKRNPAV